MLTELLRSRGFAASLHAGLWLFLVLLGVLGLGGVTVPFSEMLNQPTVAVFPLPANRLTRLFQLQNWPNAVHATNLTLFATSYFIPPTKPTPEPPPPPTTWKVTLSYQGFYRTGDGPEYTLLRREGKLMAVTVGGVVVTNLYVARADLRTLTLTNSAMQTNVLGLNTNTVVEVPLK